MTRTYSRAAALTAVALLLAFALTLAVSPAARANVLDVVRQIGGLTFNETNDYPGGEEQAVTIPGEEMTLEQAQESLPFALQLPAWAPAGYERKEPVRVTRFSAEFLTVDVDWRNAENKNISLHVQYTPDGKTYPTIIGVESAAETQVDGQPATLVRGIWSANQRKWVDNGELSLYWLQDGLSYNLSSLEEQVTVQELVQMAESMP